MAAHTVSSKYVQSSHAFCGGRALNTLKQHVHQRHTCAR